MTAWSKTCVRVLLLVLAASSASAQTVRLGVVPPVEKLAALQLGTSMMTDVRSILGAPQGEGAARMPDYPGFRTTWAYEYATTEGSQSGLFLLIVFFEERRYDGYLWFDISETFQPGS